jgi:MFS family permease
MVDVTAATATNATTATTGSGGQIVDAPTAPSGSTSALLALSVAGLVVSVVQTLVLPLLPEFMTAFHASVSSVTWIFTAALLAGAVATPLLSRFGDMYGKKRMTVVALSVLVVGSVISAVSSSLPFLIVGRTLQGVSSALIPLAIGIIRDTFARERVTTAIGIVSATMGVGGGLGMLVTGVIAAHTTSYRPVFWISAVVAVIGLAMVVVLVPEKGQGVPARPDIPGAVLLAGWLICLLLGLSEGPDWGWGSPRTVGLFAAAAVLCAGWILVELRTREPLVRLDLLIGKRSFSANLASMLLGFAMFAAFALFTNLVQSSKSEVGYGLNASVLDVGLYLLPSTAGTLIFSVFAGRLERRIGAAYSLAVGSVFVGLGLGWLAVSNGHVYDMLASSAVQGIGFGIAYAALGALAVQHVPMHSSSIASGVNSLVRTTGGSIGAAVTASLLSSYVIAGTGTPTLHAYELSYAILAAGAILAAVAAAANGLRYGSTQP